jgi:hypothetical protein
LAQNYTPQAQICLPYQKLNFIYHPQEEAKEEKELSAENNCSKNVVFSDPKFAKNKTMKGNYSQAIGGDINFVGLFGASCGQSDLL